LPMAMARERELLLAKWTRAALAFALASFSVSRVHHRAARVVLQASIMKPVADMQGSGGFSRSSSL
jgi:hypothetical protein